jgi:DNA-binding NarL/FixJ family response regulator
MNVSPDDSLSPQEHRIMKNVALGQNDAQIAHQLGIAQSTVAQYVRNVCQKLHARNRTVAAVHYYLRYGLPGQAPTGQADLVTLTTQERRVIELVAQGKTDREIAIEMELAYATVKYHIRGICRKLKMPNRTAAAVQYYRSLGMLSYIKKTGVNEDH